MGHGWGHSCLLGGNISLSFLCTVCWWQWRCEGEGDESAVSHNAPPAPRSEAKNVGDLRASQSKQRDNAGPFGICSMLSHNACSGGKRASRALQIWGLASTPLSMHKRQNSLVHTGSPILVSDRSRRALRAIRFSLYIYRYTSLQQAERHPVSEPAAHMCVRAGRAAVRSQTEIRHRNTSPCRGCSSTRPRKRVAASCRPAGYLHTGCTFITNRLVR